MPVQRANNLNIRWEIIYAKVAVFFKMWSLFLDKGNQGILLCTFFNFLITDFTHIDRSCVYCVFEIEPCLLAVFMWK